MNGNIRRGGFRNLFTALIYDHLSSFMNDKLKPAPAEPPQRTHSQWLNRQPFILSAETHQGFKDVKKTLNCKLCGHILQVGDNARWIYANSTPGFCTGNFFVCGDCDGEDATVNSKAREQFAMAVTLAKRWGIYGPDWQH